MKSRWSMHVSGATLASALLAGPASLAQDGSSRPAPATTPASSQDIVVTAKRLDEARAAIQPQIGASVYTIDKAAIEAMPGGDNVQLNQVVLQSPGVVQDSYGQLHVRGEHNGLQFRLNGVILPEGLSVFSQALTPRLADKVELITGSLPAQYGLRTAGIVDITTKSGVFANGGDVSIYGGSHDQIQPSFQYGGSSGSVNYYVSGSYLHTALGIESPDGSSTPLHDITDQYQGFGFVEDTIDANDRVSLIVGASNQRFQIPNIPGLTPSILLGPNGDQPLNVNGKTSFPSASLNESQKEATYYAIGSFLRTVDKLTTQLSLFGRYSSLQFIPDRQGDLLFTGIQQDAYKRDIAGGFQFEGVYKLTDSHTLRGGVIGEIDRATSQTTAQVIPLNAIGSQTTNLPITIVDDGAKTALTISAYLQDEWKLTDTLTLNYGLRFDQFDGYRNENQLSPRVNAVWQPTSSTTIHAGYSRYFSPPPFELVGSETINKFANTTAASSSTLNTTPYSERANYFDTGVFQKVARGLTLSVDGYYKSSKHLIDEGQFGAPIILTPFNYASGRQYGLELAGNFSRGPFTSYASFAYEKNQGENIVTSQFNFSAADLAYIANHYIYLDHNQTFTASAGASYLWRGTRFGTDLLYGSGLRITPIAGPPNGGHVPGYVEANFSLSHEFETAALGKFSLRFDIINAFDHRYEIRDGTGVGVGAPQFGARRGVFGGVTKSF